LHHAESVYAMNGRTCVLIATRRFDEALEYLPPDVPTDLPGWIRFHVRGMCLLKQTLLQQAMKVVRRQIDVDHVRR